MVISWLELQSSYLVLRRNIEASVENSYFIWDLFSYLIPHLIIFSLVPWDIGVFSFVLPPLQPPPRFSVRVQVKVYLNNLGSLGYFNNLK